MPTISQDIKALKLTNEKQQEEKISKKISKKLASVRVRFLPFIRRFADPTVENKEIYVANLVSKNQSDPTVNKC